jgi:hypothetical protein
MSHRNFLRKEERKDGTKNARQLIAKKLDVTSMIVWLGEQNGYHPY